jgi:hypothetical protein
VTRCWIWDLTRIFKLFSTRCLMPSPWSSVLPSPSTFKRLLAKSKTSPYWLTSLALTPPKFQTALKVFVSYATLTLKNTLFLKTICLKIKTRSFWFLRIPRRKLNNSAPATTLNSCLSTATYCKKIARWFLTSTGRIRMVRRSLWQLMSQQEGLILMTSM